VSESSTPSPPQFWIGVELRQPASPKEDPKFADTLAKTLAGGYVFVGFILTTIGAFQGGLQRLLLNHPWWTVLGLLLMGAGIGLAFVDAFVKSAGHKKTVILIALALFGFGLLKLVYLSTKSLSENERPGIATTASMAADGSKLEGHVTAFGVRATEWVYLSAKGFQITPMGGGDTASGNQSAQVTSERLLYRTRSGPDRSGKVDLTFAIPVAFGRFDHVRIGATRVHKAEDESIDPCFDPPNPQKSVNVDQSCATVYPPHGPERPTLSATWEKSDGVTVLNVTVKTTGADPDHVILLDMAGIGAQRRARGAIFYRSMFSGSSTGAVDATAKAPVPKGVKRVCVVGSTISLTDNTTLKTQPKTRICALRSLDLSQTSLAVITVP
jgi:hypothetical protein